MKGLVSALFLMISYLGHGQRASMPFSYIDHKALSVQSNRPDTLAHLLTAPFSTELEKVRAIFRWVTDNVAYKTRVMPNRLPSGRSYQHEDSSVDGKPLHERVAYQVLRERAAFCDGYSKLFKTLCEKAGLKAEVVTGYVRGSGSRPGEFRANHSWNAVRIDSAWYLMDPTWASGYSTFMSDEFIKRYDDFYFMTPPERMIQTHYPEDIRWTLMPQSPVVREFNRTPFKYSAYNKFRIRSFKPAHGVIEAFVGDTVELELETIDEDKKMLVVAYPVVDSSLIYEPTGLSRPGGTVSGGTIKYTYIVSSPTDKWLNVVYNDYIIMRYRLNVREREVKDAGKVLALGTPPVEE